jgi:serine/threonine protein phosphatase PrpC
MCADAALGPTVAVQVLTQSKLVVGNLGDSRCVLGKVDVRGHVSAVALSIDHTPMDPREAERVIATGVSELGCAACVSQVLPLSAVLGHALLPV